MFHESERLSRKKSFMKVQELAGNLYMDDRYTNQLEGNLRHSFHDRERNFHF